MSRNVSKGKLACLAAAIALGAASMAAPALARGGGGGWHGGGAWHGTALRSAPIHSAAINGAAWHSGWHGTAWHGRFFPHHRAAFFHRRHFGPFFGVYAGGYSSCWSWVPTPGGWRYVWVCGPYGYGYY